MAKIPIPFTKILIPKLRSDMVGRPQLVERINQGLLHDFVLLSAPAGSGKTTLLVQWAQQSPFPVAWLTLDSRDNVPAIFYQNLLFALHTAIPEFSPVEQTLPQHQEASEALMSGLVTLLNEVSEMNRDIVLVLDDFHLITNPEIQAASGFLLESIPAKVHLILSSRIDPQFSLNRLRAHDQIDEIRNNLLKFNVEESREFFQKAVKIQLTPQAEEWVMHQTEGWVAGMQLAAISLQHQPDLASEPGFLTGDNSYIQEFLFDEVFSVQSDGVQQFLLRTSILRSLTGSLCDAMLNREKAESAATLHELYHENLFLTALDHEEHWFRYHPLFAESLQHMLIEKMPDEVNGLHLRASQWYEQSGMIDEAVDHALRAEDFQLAASIMERNIGDLFKNGGIQLALTWLKKIPEEILKQIPTLCVAYAWGLVFSFSMDQAEYWIQAAETNLADSCGIPLTEIENKQYSPDSRHKNLMGEIFAVKSIAATTHLNSIDALEYSRRALDYLDAGDLYFKSYMAMEQSIYDMLDGNMVAAETSLEETIRLSQSCGNWMINMIARCHLGETQAARGQLSKALMTFKQSIPLTVDPEGKPMGFVGHLYVEMGDVLLERNELAQAENYITQGIELSRLWLPMLIELDARLHLTQLYAAQENFASARHEITAARALTDTTSSTFDDIIISIHEARLKLKQGDLRYALDWAHSQDLLSDSIDQKMAGYPFSIATSIITLVSHIWLALSRQEKNPSYAQKAYDLVKPLETPLSQRDQFEMQLEVWIIEALALQEMGKIDEALDLVTTAYALGEPEGYRRIFLDEGVPMARLTNRLISHRKRHQSAYHLPTHEYLMEMIRLFSTGKQKSFTMHPDEITPENADFAFPVEMLTPRELEVLQQVAEGKTNGEIALQLCLALNTVKRHLNSIFMKLGVTSRVQAVSTARNLNLVK